MLFVWSTEYIWCDVPQRREGGNVMEEEGLAGLAEALTRITLGAGVSDLNKSLFYSLVLAGTE